MSLAANAEMLLIDSEAGNTSLDVTLTELPHAVGALEKNIVSNKLIGAWKQNRASVRSATCDWAAFTPGNKVGDVSYEGDSEQAL